MLHNRNMKLLNKLKNRLKYKSHTAEVHRFISNNYTLEVKECRGPIIDSEPTKELYYLVIFKKECPENSITLKIDIETKTVSEVERL